MRVRSEMSEQLKRLIDQRQLEKFKDAIVDQSRLSIGLVPRRLDDDQIGVGASKLGGRPDVPEGFDWPSRGDTPLSFVAQINLEELQEQTGGEERLPARGLLSLFYDNISWGFDPEDRDCFRFLHLDGDLSGFTRKQPPPVRPKKVLFGLLEKSQEVRQYESAFLSFEKFYSLPDNADHLGIKDDGDFDEYYELVELIGNHHRMLGYPEPIQLPMELECELVTNGINCGSSVDIDDSRMKRHEEAARDWRLLLQIDSDCQATDMMWGDAGRLYVWIKEGDLSHCRFEKAWMLSQCH